MPESTVLLGERLITQNSVYSSFSDATNSFVPSMVHPGFYQVQYNGADSNAPDTSNNAWQWNVWDFGSVTRRTQIAMCPFRNRDRFYMRQKHDGNWYGWYRYAPELSLYSVAFTWNGSLGTSGLSLYKYGRICVLNGTIQNNAVGINLYAATIDDVSARPIQDCYPSVSRYTSAGSPEAELLVRTNGSVIMAADQRAAWKVHGVWITAS